ncbi:MAG: phosphoadenosine phosphosulfate reductase domain-containing protein [Verrucomicrobiota bacterium]
MDLQKTIQALEARARINPVIAVSYSGGKDSLAVMDLCCKIFPTVRAFFWYCVPDLEVCNEWMRFAKERWNVEVVQLPHWDMMTAMKNGVWCDATKGIDKLPEMKLKDAYAYSLDLVETDFCATGMKDADGLPRRQFFANLRDSKDPIWRRLIFPIRDWNKKDVLDYLKTNGIPIPEAEPGAVTTGVGLNHDSLCWLHDKHPEDFKRLLKWYPYAEAAIKRRDWYGVGV